MSGYTISPTDQDVYGVLQPFIALVTGLDPSLVIQGLPNRSAMPEASPGFVVMQDVRFKPLSYTENTWDPTATAPTTITVAQDVQGSIQIDCYGSNSENWAKTLAMLLRNDIGFQALAPVCAPLYCSGASLGPLDDSEQQYEQRWTFELQIETTATVAPPQQYANTAGPVDTVNVDEKYHL